MSSTPYNIDADQEYFEFTLKGHVYRFRHMNTSEMAEITTFKDDNEKSLEYLFSFITTEDPEAPDFKEATKTFIAPQWKKFREMLEAEFGAKAI